MVAVVVTGLYLGHRLPTLMSAASRLQMDAFWRILKFLLEGLVFLVVGLQLRDDRAPAARAGRPGRADHRGVVLAVVVGRLVWVFPATYLARLVPAGPAARPGAAAGRSRLVIGWAGMRGVVTLATALALPATLAGGASYPRTLFVWLAFAVIVATLVLQGTTLPVVARWLRIAAGRPDRRTPGRGPGAERGQPGRPGRGWTQQADGAPQEVVDRLRAADRAALQRGVGAARRRRGRRRREAYVRLRREMLDAERGGVPGGPRRGADPGGGAGRGPSASWTWKSRCWNGATMNGVLQHLSAAADPSPADHRGLPGVPGDRLPRLGAPAAVPRLRPRRLLRLVAVPARDRPLWSDGAPGDALVPAGRDVALVLRGRTRGVTTVTRFRNLISKRCSD